MTYRVALIGAGNIGTYHARQWAAMPDAEVVGVLDPRPEAASALGQAYSDWQALLAQAKPDIVDICAPISLHREWAERAAAAGLAIVVEAPLGQTQEDCAAMVAAVERAGVPAMAASLLRFTPVYIAAKRLVDRGAVGAPAAVRLAFESGAPASSDPAGFALSGGVVQNRLVQEFDWLRWTFGPVTRVFAHGLASRPELAGTLDYALVTLRFESGAVGHVTGSWAHTGPERTTLEIAGDGGLIEYDSARSVSLTASLHSEQSARAESPLADADDPYSAAFAALVRALREKTPMPVTLADAAEAVRIALAARESITTGKVVAL